jgi:hypothetical protein
MVHRWNVLSCGYIVIELLKAWNTLGWRRLGIIASPDLQIITQLLGIGIQLLGNGLIPLLFDRD